MWQEVEKFKGYFRKALYSLSIKQSPSAHSSHVFRLSDSPPSLIDPKPQGPSPNQCLSTISLGSVPAVGQLEAGRDTSTESGSLLTFNHQLTCIPAIIQWT
ncbi:hypothetical protein XENOCAPTIV_025940 [Xenoophorus captivus]|uniref:Uncharacterized protein n=1 Tax=Xenoophorus captivus TaxID=1517983 RepID=A0ABV0RMB8_9TELE